MLNAIIGFISIVIIISVIYISGLSFYYVVEKYFDKNNDITLIEVLKYENPIDVFGLGIFIIFVLIGGFALCSTVGNAIMGGFY